MKKLFKVEAVKKGYIAHRQFIKAENEAQAIDFVKMQNNVKGAKWRSEEA